MNPMTNVKNIQKLNQLELQLGGKGKTSWHQQYKDSAWIFVGGLPYDLTEGDVLAVFSQYGEIVNINLVRDKGTGKSKGFAFLCYEDQRSTILTVDNLNSLKILGRTLRVDHCENYRRPKETGEEDDLTQQLRAVGCAPKTPSASEEEEEESFTPVKKLKKEKDPTKKKKVKKEKKRKREKGIKVESDDDSKSHQKKKAKGSHDSDQPIKVKQEKIDPGYNKYATNRASERVDLKRPYEIKQEREDRSVVKERTRDAGRLIKQEKDDRRDSERLNERYVREGHKREKSRNTERADRQEGFCEEERRGGSMEDRRERFREDGMERLREDRRGGNSDRYERDHHRDQDRYGDRNRAAANRDRTFDQDRERERHRDNGRGRDSYDCDRNRDRESDRGRDRDSDSRRKRDR